VAQPSDIFGTALPLALSPDAFPAVSAFDMMLLVISSGAATQGNQGLLAVSGFRLQIDSIPASRLFVKKMNIRKL